MNSQECPCPSCGFYTTGETLFGSYVICCICGWEDDAVQLANPVSRGGANGASLIEYQQESLNEYPIAIQKHGLYERDPTWRPLTQQEVGLAKKGKNELPWKNKAICDYLEAYWVKKAVE